MSVRARRWVGLIALVFVGAACTQQAEAADPAATEDEIVGPRIISPANGEAIDGTVTIEIDTGTLDPTGATVPIDKGGQFHLMVDEGCVDNGESVPVGSDNSYAFDEGATSMTVDLPVGAHELCVQFANAYDVAYYATDSVTIRVTG